MDIFDFDRRDPYHRAASLEDLCRFSDANFIRCAFVTILGRQPDPDGEAHYLDGLRRGTSKLGIISDLRVSAEGNAHDPGIAGLDKALRKHRNEIGRAHVLNSSHSCASRTPCFALKKAAHKRD